MANVSTRFGLKVRAIREKRKFSQEQLGDKLGVDKATINRIEKGATKNPGVDLLEKLCKIFEISADYFLTSIPFETQVEIDKDRDLNDKLRKLGNSSYQHYKDMIEREYIDLQIVAAKLPLRKRYEWAD